jgi:hypothetical protein
MSFFNDNFLPIIQKYVDKFRLEGKTEFYTVELIRAYTGHYYADETQNANESINANIGKFLYENKARLRLDEKSSSQYVVDDLGNSSHSSIWIIL